MTVQKLVLEKKAKSGANWFIWIAALSLVNSAIALMGSNTRFIIGLGITQVVDEVATKAGGNGNIVALVFDVFVAAIVAGFGLLARKQREWAFILGMILYALDGMLFLLAKDILSIAFHIFALFMLYKGLKAAEAFKKIGTPAIA